MNAGEHDCVLFEGSGSTGAIHKLIHVLDLQEPPVSVVMGFYILQSFYLAGMYIYIYIYIVKPL